MASKHAIFFACLLTQTLAWEALPNIPSGRRSQYFVLKKDGGYKYGYDTGSGNAAKQEGDSSNQVEGQYFFKNSAGQELNLKYTSGVQGFQPEGLEKIQQFIASSGPAGPSPQPYSSNGENGDNAGSYKPDNTGEYQPDNNGDNAGSYQPDNTGEYQPDNSGDYQPDNSGDYKGEQEPAGDASYNFNIDTSSYKRTETSDASGNVQGRYSYSDNAGNHDLEYVAGSEKGFIARSGSLSLPNGLGGKGPAPSAPYSAPTPYSAQDGPTGGYSGSSDGSYSFGFNTGDQSRQESSDASGNVKGSYSYKNSAGSHDLNYVAGSSTGFLPTGGSLVQPNGLGDAGPAAEALARFSAPRAPNTPSGPANARSSASEDGSYSFGFSTGDQERQEDSDASGNVKGRYSYKNSAGSHDLSYIAGSSTGFLPTGGSLAQPNGLNGRAGGSVPSSYEPLARSSNEGPQDGQANTGDASYKFSFDTPEYRRSESSDASGNVRGSFSYTNKAGTNDLSFVAGSATGFQPTGGSLASPNGLNGKQASAPQPYSSDAVAVNAAGRSGYSGDASSGDASYNFAFDTNDYKRQESSDASGNVKGSFSYTNSAGNHDLNFVAGSATGFQPTGGNLTPAPGLTEAQLNSGFRSGGSSDSSSISSFVSGKSSYTGPSVPSSEGDTKAYYRLGNVQVYNYLPPSNAKNKFGYIFDTQY